MQRIIFLIFILSPLFSRTQESISVKLRISVSPELKPSCLNTGRLIFRLTGQAIPGSNTKPEAVFGLTAENWDPSKPIILDSKQKNVLVNGLEKLKGHIAEKFYYQIIYKQNIADGNERVAGNLYSEVDSFSLTNKVNLNITLNKTFSPAVVVNNRFVKTVEIKSKYLSDFFGSPRYLKASILLPSGYFDNPEKNYPICYRAPGLNGRYDQINGMMNNKDFYNWWFSKEAPQVIYIFLDSQGPYGDTYQVDSENNGPCGKALTEELIPEIEKQVHYLPESKKRYLAGRSTGGWVALGLQIFYPDFFDGAWSYSPDPVDFEHYGLIDIYHDSTIFYNKWGYLQPGRRTIYGEPTFSMKDWIAGENINSRTNDYRISGGQFGAYNAVFGPRGSDGLPTLMFDPVSGKIDHAIVKQWEKYDLKKILEKNWPILGPKLQGKIWIWTGDMDGLYSNVATRFLQKFIEKTENPKSDAVIRFTPMAGHTQEWSDKAVLQMVANKAAGK